MGLDVQKMKEQLTTELAVLTAELQSLGIQDPTTPGEWIPTQGTPSVSKADENVLADRAEDSEERRSTLATLATRHNNILRALSKIEAGTYGICEINNGEIEADRLEANPAARTCKTHIDNEVDLTE